MARYFRYISKKQLSAKLTMLLCLISCKRVSDVRALALAGRVFSTEGVLFHISKRTKTNIRSVHYPVFLNNHKLCVVRCLKEYEDVTRVYRQDSKGPFMHFRSLLGRCLQPHWPGG